MMLNEKEQAELDQAAAKLGDNLPALWRRIYGGCKDKGFTDIESFKLLQTYILSNGPNGVGGADG